MSLRRALCPVLAVLTCIGGGCSGGHERGVGGHESAQPSDGPARTLPPARSSAPDLALATPLQPVDELVQAALTNDERVRRADLDQAMQAHHQRDAGAWANPELRLRRTFPSVGTNDDSIIDTAVRWRPPSPWGHGAERDEAAARSDEAAASALMARHDIALRIRSTYASLLLQRRLVELDAARLALERQRADSVTAAAALGMGTIAETAGAGWRLAAAEGVLADTRQDLAAIESDLRRASGWTQALPVVEPRVPMPESIAAARVMAAANHPEVANAQAAARRARARLVAAGAADKPWLTYVEAGWKPLENGESDTAVGLGIEVPLFDRGAGARAAAALEAGQTADEPRRCAMRAADAAEAAWVTLQSRLQRQHEHQRRAAHLLDQIEQALIALDVPPARVADSIALRVDAVAIRREGVALDAAVLLARLTLHDAIGVLWIGPDAPGSH